MNAKLILAAAAVATAMSAVSQSWAKEELSEQFNKTLPLKPGGKLDFDNVNGRVRVEGWDRAEVQIDAVKRAKSQEGLDKIQIVIDDDPSEIRIRTKLPRDKFHLFSSGDSGSVDYTIKVPRDITLDAVKTVNGEIAIEGVRGRIEAKTVNGKLVARAVSGPIELSTVNGSIDATLDAVDRKGAASIETVNGSITLTLPKSANVDLLAETVNGSIKTDFGTKTKKNFPIGHELKATLGSGGTRMKLSTVNGKIEVRGGQELALEK